VPQPRKIADGGITIEKLASDQITACINAISPGILEFLIGQKAAQSHHRAIY
jgi:hypothetical protein